MGAGGTRSQWRLKEVGARILVLDGWEAKEVDRDDGNAFKIGSCRLSGPSEPGRKSDFVQGLYSRFAFLALLALLAFLEISNLCVINTWSGFDSRRLHHT